MGTYNGWSNYETWKLSLEVCNDYADMLSEDGTKFASTYDLAQHFKETAEELVGEGEGYAYDLAQSFLISVNWHEIADHWRDELIAKDDDEEDETDDDEEESE